MGKIIGIDLNNNYELLSEIKIAFLNLIELNKKINLRKEVILFTNSGEVIDLLKEENKKDIVKIEKINEKICNTDKEKIQIVLNSIKISFKWKNDFKNKFL